MASSHRSDWLTAKEEYFDALDRKHPDHPYKEQLRKWRDQILLDEAEGRARNLSSPVKTQFSEPHSNGERQYVTFDTLAAKAIGEGNETMAAQYWRELARVLKPEDRDERPWYLLAVRRADELEAKIQERRAFVIDQLERADAALKAGRPNEAVAIRAMLSEKYAQYADLSDLLGTASGPKSQVPRPGTDAAPSAPPGQAPASAPPRGFSPGPRAGPQPGRDIHPTARRSMTLPRQNRFEVPLERCVTWMPS